MKQEAESVEKADLRWRLDWFCGSTCEIRTLGPWWIMGELAHSELGWETASGARR